MSCGGWRLPPVCGARLRRLGRLWPVGGPRRCEIVCWKPRRPDVPGIVKDMAPYRRWLDPLLREAYAQAEKDKDPRKQLHASLALLPVDPGQVDYLYGRLLKGKPRKSSSFERHCRTTRQIRRSDCGRCWRIRRTIRTIASVRPVRWRRLPPMTLAGKKPVATWRNAGHPEAVCDRPMDRCLEGRGTVADPAVGRLSCGRKTQRLGKGLIATRLWHLRRRHARCLCPAGEAAGRKKRPRCSGRSQDCPGKEAGQHRRGPAGHGPGREGLAAVEAQPDPTLRSYLIERLGPGGVDAKMLTARLEEEKEVSVRRAILLSLGEFGLDRLPRPSDGTFCPGCCNSTGTTLIRGYTEPPNGCCDSGRRQTN